MGVCPAGLHVFRGRTTVSCCRIMGLPVVYILCNQSVSVYSAQSQRPYQPGLPLVSDPVCDIQTGNESFQFGNLRITPLLVADDVVLLASLFRDLLSEVCEAVWMRFWHHDSVDCPSDFGGCPLPRAKDFLLVLFIDDGKMEHELGRQFGAESAVLQALRRKVVVKRELSGMAKTVHLCSNPS